ncbi:MAG TPA: imelysin family protein [Candidatus Thiothrix moscowensis]|uniref:imelysin family protein n=1 Tax=unclassified Thiothrix TaxID=2636184 RepID=UPI0025CDB8D0|nr:MULTISPECIES: imelysin family protein [unclassified Thiothrix]HRJ52521.1 imelysin family protein [Candidatus Thiothrix moscowensis]HRJ93293.1 imelysin family protein [Candidatus Thiothrix moscowensis]
MQRIRQLVSAALFGSLLATTAPLVQADTISTKAVMETYVNIAHASFDDALATAKILQDKINAFIANPSAETHQAAKDAWLAARIPYGQTEAFRFSNKNVDEWEGQVNAWPLDEGLIDYVKQDSYDHEEGNPFASANIIAGKDPINVELLKSLNEKGGSEANVGTGYHAIEFLLWGQDFNENPQDAGKRPHTDYAKADACTNGNCERRAEYLKAATDLLVADLQTMADDWASGKENYRKAFLAIDEQEAVRRMLFGMGSLSLGELAGERMNVALLARSQEDEHSCFSDNTHHDIAENARSIQNIFNGTYTRTNGTTVTGTSLAQLLAAKDAKVSETLVGKLADTQQKVEAIVTAAKNGEHFDQQITADNKDGNKRIKTAIAALRSQTGDIEAAAKVLGIDNLNPESSDSFGG